MSAPPLTVPADAGGVSNGSASNGKVANPRVEVQLRARLAELEARLADMGRCLEDAEQRAGDLLATQAWAALLEQRMAVIVTSRSWRLTTPLRRGMVRARGSVSR